MDAQRQPVLSLPRGFLACRSRLVLHVDQAPYRFIEHWQVELAGIEPDCQDQPVPDDGGLRARIGAMSCIAKL